MNHATSPLSRRRFLRNAAATLALPFLPSAFYTRSLSAATKGSARPLRMGIFTVTGGTVIESWRPAEVGPLAGQKLPSILRPLQPFADDMLVLSNLSLNGRADNMNAHEHCASLHLTSAESCSKQDNKIMTSVSVDQVAAGLVGADTLLPSLEIGYARGENKYSFTADGRPVSYEGNPRAVYERMFGRNGKPAKPNWNKVAAAATERASATAAAAPPAPTGPKSYERSVLDLLMGEANDLRRYLGYEDKQKFEEYLDSVRSVETRLAKLEDRVAAQTADKVILPVTAPHDDSGSPLDLPGDYSDLPDDGRYREIYEAVGSDPEGHAEYIRVMSDLMVLAFMTDSTRVCTLALGTDQGLFPGVVTVGHERHAHTLEHNGNSSRPEDADPIAREGCRQIHAWYTTLFAETVRKLKGIDDGGVPLLDNCMLLYTSYMADGGHGRKDYPVMLVGKAGGTIKPGRHVEYDRGTSMGSLYVEMLQRLGDKSGKFGDASGGLKNLA